MLLKQELDFLFILLQQCGALTFEFRLNASQLNLVVITHLIELNLHASNQVVDVIIHLLHGFYVVLVLCFDRLLKLLFKLVFVLYDLLTLTDLLLDVQVQLLTIFLLLKLLPVPVDLHIFLM